MNFESIRHRIGKATAAIMALDASSLLPFTSDTTNSFPRQWEYVSDNARAIALLCSRRSGKTIGTDIRTCKRNTEHRGRKVLYIHHTRKLAKDQFYKKVVARLRKHAVPFEKNDSELLIEWANGSILLCIGCNDVGDVGKARGYDWDEVIIEEIQEFSDEVLKELLDEAILPTMFDRAGSIIAQGTPPVAHAGVWWDILNNQAIDEESEGVLWSQLRWTLLENPHIKKANIVNTMALRGFVINFDDPTKNDPIVQREVFGLLAIDPSKLVYIYSADRNAIGEGGRPDPKSDQWRYSLGLDLGLEDCDAISVLGWRMDDPEHRIYEVYSWKENHLDVDALAPILKDAVLAYRPVSLVGDTGGHGATKVLATLAERLGVTFLPKPTSVRDSVALMNDDYRAGRLKIDASGILAQESAKVAWDAKRKKFATSFHSDITEAARYAHHAAILGGFFKSREAPPKPTLLDERRQAMLEKARRTADPTGIRRRMEGDQEWITG